MTSQGPTILKAVTFLAGDRKLEPHQAKAFSDVWEALTPAAQAKFVTTWQGEPKPAPAPQDQAISLSVPYFSQRDSATGQGDRMCFSSSCAMAASFIKPGCLAGSGQPDDRYLALVQRFGDTTDARAQIAALKSLGIRATFRQDGSIDDLIAELQVGRPAAVGWLHKGPVTAPSGGGHWTLAIGWDPGNQQVIMHDPFGEANLVAGGYVTTAIGSGKGQRYSTSNWGKRWMVEGPKTGWWMQFAV